MAGDKITPQRKIRKDLTGKTFGRWTVLEVVGRKPGVGATWLCRCNCGSERILPICDLTQGRSRSCGCLAEDGIKERSTTHGMSYTREYKIWGSMLERCYNESHIHYKDYGGRGISVCPEWKISFEEFYSYVGPRPSPKHSIDRYPNNDGNYEPGNVRWATHRQQNLGRRDTIYVTVNGVTKSLVVWCEENGIMPNTARQRLYGGVAPEIAVTAKRLKGC